MATTGTALANFTDFMDLTGPKYITPIDKVLNEAQKVNYGILSRLLRGRGPEAVLQGGDSIKDVVMFDAGESFGWYHPNDEHEAQQPQLTDTISIPWRFAKDHMSWNDQIIELNIPDGASAEAQKTAYKKLKRVIEMAMWTRMLGGIDSSFWRSPLSNYSQMEDEKGLFPYSIPAFVTEDTTNYHYNGWTTIEGIDPANEPKWRNQVSNYDKAHTLGDPDGDGDGLIDAFDEMWLKTQFIAPPTRQEYFENSDMNGQFIACSRLGLNRYKRELRASNDSLVSKQDAAYQSPTYSGVDLLYCSELDNAAIFDPGSTGTGSTESSASAAGPRYFWLNRKYLKPVFHKRRYMTVHKVRSPDKQWFSHVQPVDCWLNLFCHSRQRLGIVAPV